MYKALFLLLAVAFTTVVPNQTSAQEDPDSSSNIQEYSDNRLEVEIELLLELERRKQGQIDRYSEFIDRTTSLINQFKQIEDPVNYSDETQRRLKSALEAIKDTKPNDNNYKQEKWIELQAEHNDAFYDFRNAVKAYTDDYDALLNALRFKRNTESSNETIAEKIDLSELAIPDSTSSLNYSIVLESTDNFRRRLQNLVNKSSGGRVDSGNAEALVNDSVDTIDTLSGFKASDINEFLNKIIIPDLERIDASLQSNQQTLVDEVSGYKDRVAKLDRELVARRQAVLALKNDFMKYAVLAMIVGIVMSTIILILAARSRNGSAGDGDAMTDLIKSRVVVEILSMGFLLLVVLMLGLAGVLTAEIIGTVLGSIAGYIFARAATK